MTAEAAQAPLHGHQRWAGNCCYLQLCKNKNDADTLQDSANVSHLASFFARAPHAQVCRACPIQKKSLAAKAQKQAEAMMTEDPTVSLKVDVLDGVLLCFVALGPWVENVKKAWGNHPQKKVMAWKIRFSDWDAPPLDQNPVG
jgi:hypothetical protein